MSNNSFRKPFNKNLFKVYDKKAKEAAPAILKQIPEYKNLLIKENMLTEFGYDLDGLEHTKNELNQNIFTSVKQVECEVKLSWKTGKYPFSSIRIPARKLKFKGSDWLMFREDCKAAIHIPASVVSESPIISMKTKVSGESEELFIEITDLRLCKFLEILDDLY